MEYDIEDDFEDDYCSIDVDVLIVGAGLAGLSAAFKLRQKAQSLTIRILEANEEIGGQIIRCPLGELGGKWITEEQQHVFNLVRSLSVPMKKRQAAKENNDLPRCWELDMGKTSYLAKFELHRYINELDYKLYQYRSGVYKIGSNKQTMLQHIEKKLYFTKSRNFMGNLVLMTCGIDAGAVPFEDFMQTCASYGGVSKVLELYFLFPEKLWEIDSNNLLKALVAQLGNADIRRNVKVMEIHPFREHVKVVDSSRNSHCASVVLLAVQWPDIVNLHNNAFLPDSLRIPEGLLRKQKFAKTSIIARFDRPYWRDAGYSGHFVSHYPLIIGYVERKNVYCCLCIHEKEIDVDIDTVVLRELSKYFGNGMLCPIELHMKTFRLSYVEASGKINKCDRIIWCSSEVTGTCHRGSLNGAVESGLKAALNTLMVLRPQSISFRDTAELKCKVIPLQSDTTWIYRLASSWNIYNIAFFGAALTLFAIVFRAVWGVYQNTQT